MGNLPALCKVENISQILYMCSYHRYIIYKLPQASLALCRHVVYATHTHRQTHPLSYSPWWGK